MNCAGGTVDVASRCAPIKSHSSSSRWCDSQPLFRTHEHSSRRPDPNTPPCESPGVRVFFQWASRRAATSPSPTCSSPEPEASLSRYSRGRGDAGKAVGDPSSRHADQWCPHHLPSDGSPVSGPAGGTVSPRQQLSCGTQEDQIRVRSISSPDTITLLQC